MNAVIYIPDDEIAAIIDALEGTDEGYTVHSGSPLARGHTRLKVAYRQMLDEQVAAEAAGPEPSGQGGL